MDMQMHVQVCGMGAKGYLWLWEKVVDLTTDADALAMYRRSEALKDYHSVS